MNARRVLILGGTIEAVDLAKALDDDSAFEPITSLAGRTIHPTSVPGTIRSGGFGGADGLARYLAAEGIDRLVDATHPFAEQISRNAKSACARVGVPRLRLDRPPWSRQPGDRWIEGSEPADAARRLPDDAGRVFLSIGRQDLEPFCSRPDIWFLLRMIDPPAEPIPLPRYDLVLGRGPFAQEDEEALLAQYQIDALVSRNSGGSATYGKIAAARRLGLPVVMISRPPPPAGTTVDSVEAAIAWLEAGPGRAPAAEVD